MTEAEKDILKQIQQFSGRHSPYTVFSDCMTMLALSIANTCTMIHGKTWQEREEWYEATKKKYMDKEFQMFAEMTAYLIEALDEDMTDVLGGVFMLSGAGNGRLGQFFTPFHISELLFPRMISVRFQKGMPHTTSSYRYAAFPSEI